MTVSGIIVAVGVVLLIGFVTLILLWAFTEELPRVEEHVPYYKRLDQGKWGVRLVKVGRRRMRAMRLVNEVIGGDLSRAKYIVENPPAVVVEGISEELAHELAAELQKTGAEVEVCYDPRGSVGLETMVL